MYYYNSSGKQIAANSFSPMVENYRYGSGEGESSESGKSSNKIMLYAIIGLAVLLLVIFLFNSKPKKNQMSERFGYKFVL